MRNLPGTCSLLLLSSALLGQTPTAAHVILLSSPTQGCPVGLAANRLPGGGVVSVESGRGQRRPAWRVSFQPAIVHSSADSGYAIVGAKVTLHGLSGSRGVPALSGRLGESKEEFTLVLAADRDHAFSSTVYPGKLTGVTSIELNELTYADGTQWHEAAESACEVAPNGYMLVANTR